MTSSRSWRKSRRLGSNGFAQSLWALDAEPIPKLPKKGRAPSASSTSSKTGNAKAGGAKARPTDVAGKTTRPTPTGEATAVRVAPASPSRRDAARMASASARDSVLGRKSTNALASGSAAVGDIVHVVTDVNKMRQALVVSVSNRACTVAWVKKGNTKQHMVPWHGVRELIVPASQQRGAPNPMPGARLGFASRGSRRPGVLANYRKDGRVDVHFHDVSPPEMVILSLADLRAAPLTPQPTAGRPRTVVASSTADGAGRKTARRPARRADDEAPTRRRVWDEQPPRRAAPVSTGPVRNERPADVFPVGTVVEFESGGVRRRGEVRRTVGTSEVIVAFDGPSGPVARPFMRHRLRSVS